MGGAARRPFLLLAVWFGILTGFAELLVLAVEKWFHHRFIFVGHDAVWMTPLSAAGFFAAAGLPFWIGGRLRPGLVSWRLAVGVGLFLATVSVLLRFPRIHWAATLLLATGFAVQLSRVLARREASFQAVVRRTTPWLCALVVALAVGTRGWFIVAERRALASLPSTPAGAPNILLIILDTVRAANLSLYGYTRPTTPELEHWARTGTVFELAYATAPWTLPSHATIFTGRHPHQLAANWFTPLERSHPTLGELLRAKGYAAAGFVANQQYASYEVGLARGFAHYEDYRISVRQTIESTTLGKLAAKNRSFQRFLRGYLRTAGVRKTAEDINRAMLSWLDRSGRRPFFAFLNYLDAHDPYYPPQPYFSMFGATKTPKYPGRNPNQRWTRAEIQMEMDAYDGALAYLDSRLAALFSQLNQRGRLENTLIIVTSDHGEEFGEHGLIRHGNSLYDIVLRVPLVISFPGRVPADRRIKTPVSLLDLPATILDLVELDDGHRLPGRSLARFWRGGLGPESQSDTLVASVRQTHNNPDWYPAVRGDLYGVMFDGLRYIKNAGDGAEELYQPERDSLEQNDLSRTERGQAELLRFRSALEVVISGRRALSRRLVDP